MPPSKSIVGSPAVTREMARVPYWPQWMSDSHRRRLCALAMEAERDLSQDKEFQRVVGPSMSGKQYAWSVAVVREWLSESMIYYTYAPYQARVDVLGRWLADCTLRMQRDVKRVWESAETILRGLQASADDIRRDPIAAGLKTFFDRLPREPPPPKRGLDESAFLSDAIEMFTNRLRRKRTGLCGTFMVLECAGSFKSLKCGVDRDPIEFIDQDVRAALADATEPVIDEFVFAIDLVLEPGVDVACAGATDTLGLFYYDRSSHGLYCGVIGYCVVNGGDRDPPIVGEIRWSIPFYCRQMHGLFDDIMKASKRTIVGPGTRAEDLD